MPRSSLKTRLQNNSTAWPLAQSSRGPSQLDLCWLQCPAQMLPSARGCREPPYVRAAAWLGRLLVCRRLALGFSVPGSLEDYKQQQAHSAQCTQEALGDASHPPSHPHHRAASSSVGGSVIFSSPLSLGTGQQQSPSLLELPADGGQTLQCRH